MKKIIANCLVVEDGKKVLKTVDVTKNYCLEYEVENNLHKTLSIELLGIKPDSIKLTADASNCGVVNISGFGFTNWTLPVYRNMMREIENIIDGDFPGFSDRNFLVGTINKDQEERFGDFFRKNLWNISYLFNNPNSNLDCYLITRDIYK